jgi:hypothetical protein
MKRWPFRRKKRPACAPGWRAPVRPKQAENCPSCPARHRRPAGYRSSGASQGRLVEGDRAADRYQHRTRQVLPRHARVFAEFETNLRRERQLAGIAKAKAAGVYKGRPASIDVTKVRQIESKGHGGVGDRQGPEDRSRLRLQSAWRARVVGGRRHKLGHKRCRRRQHLFASLEEIAASMPRRSDAPRTRNGGPRRGRYCVQRYCKVALVIKRTAWLVFLASDRKEQREDRVRRYIASAPGVALLLAAVNFESVCRAVLFLSRSQNADLRIRLGKCYGLDAYKELWKTEVAS